METTEYLAAQKKIVLTEAQRQAVIAPDGPVLLLAVPGAGKTTVVTARIAHLIAERGALPERILTLTFNREAAREMSARWTALFGEALPGVEPRFSTIHSFCFALLREYADARGTAMPRVIDEAGDRTAALLGALYREATGAFLTEDRRQQLESAMSYAVNMQLDDAGLHALEDRVDGFYAVYRGYTDHKRAHGLMDFDDMLSFTLTMLERQPAFCRRIADRFDHILVDEAQDTSRIQQEILHRIAKNSIFLVGDEDQSIYGFRGAFPQGILDFAQRFPGAQILRIEENFRSLSAITSAAQLLIGDNKKRYSKRIHPVRGEGGRLLFKSDLPLDEEYDYIAQRLRTLSQSGSCAALYRNGYTAIALSRALRRIGLPYFCRGGSVGFATDAVTRDVLNLIALARDPSDAAAFRQVYFRLGCPISRDAAQEALAEPRRDLLDWILEHADYPAKNSGRLQWTMRVLRGMAKASPQKQVQTILGDLQYLAALERRGQSGYGLNQAIQKLCLLEDIARDCADDGAFSDAIAAAEGAVACADGNAVTLSTVHSAKGQEFDHILIADALDGIFPEPAAVEESASGCDDGMEEERRLFYTALTRARDSAEIVSPAEGNGRRLVPSRFAGRLDESLPLIDGEPVAVGMRVAHCAFGIGEILRVEPARGRFTAQFAFYGNKTFALDALADGKLFRRI